MTEFVASNGIRVYLDESRSVQWNGSVHGERKEKITQAFREFFLHERDVELGRWRSKADPDYVAYDHGDGRARFLRESDGVSYSFDRRSAGGSYPATAAEIAFQRVAREFFAAHPEPKPWETAQPGDVWALTDTNGEDGYVFGVDDVWHHTVHPDRWCDPREITAGRRIWPEATK